MDCWIVDMATILYGRPKSSVYDTIFLFDLLEGLGLLLQHSNNFHPEQYSQDQLAMPEASTNDLETMKIIPTYQRKALQQIKPYFKLVTRLIHDTFQIQTASINFEFLRAPIPVTEPLLYSESVHAWLYGFLAMSWLTPYCTRPMHVNPLYQPRFEY